MSMHFTISSSPHLKDRDTTSRIMLTVILSLIPAGIFSVYIFGIRVLWVILAGIFSALITEWICQKLMSRQSSITDGSAILTGLLIAYNVPPEVPLWIPIAGSIFGILIGKQIFGGLGYNPMNPALIGRAFLMASWPVHMTVFNTAPKDSTLSGIQAITNATPLSIYSHSREVLMHATQYTTDQVTEATLVFSQLYSSIPNLFYGRTGGVIGETSTLLLIIGAFFLMFKRIIGWKIPFTFIGTVALLSWIFGGTTGLFSGNPLFHMMSGGLILGAFFMATDMVTTPITFKGRIIFGFGCGLLTVVIRLWGGYPEGVSYAILLMNLATPLLDKTTAPKIFGDR